MPKANRLNLFLRVSIHIGSMLPLAVIIFDYFTGRLSINPIQEITQRTGRTAIWLLMASLACTPINTIFQFPITNQFRRTLGLYAFGYAAFHFIMFTVIDYRLAIDQIIQTILEKRFLLAGVPSFIILTILALTSFRFWQNKLGKTWKHLHRIVYVGAILAMIHYVWAVKGNIVLLQGNILQPALVLTLLIILLLLRIPFVRTWITSHRSNRNSSKPEKHASSK